MAKQKSLVPRLKLGDRVKILCFAGQRGRIVELRGALGPGGIHVYRVRVPRKPKPAYIELREDQLVALPAQAPQGSRTLNGETGPRLEHD
jgi:hypothetical protein